MSLSGDLTSSGSFRLTITQGKGKFSATLVKKVAYVKGNAAFWTSSGVPAQATQVLAGKWVRMPEAESASLAKEFRDLAPAHVAKCLGTSTGTVVKAGTGTVGGRKAIILRDKGDKPGTEPGRLWVAATGSALPLRITQTGPQRPGGTPRPGCEEQDDTTQSSSLRLSNYNKVKTITAPEGALDLGALQNGQGTTTS